MENYDDILIDAVEWARRAGSIHLDFFRSNHLDVKVKQNESDIVTKADRMADALITENIHKRYPSHSILAEESGEDDRDGDFTWVIDPLDGTTNYTAGLPTFAVSIGVHHRGVPVVGVVFAPYLNELFTAVKGKGARLNGEPIGVRANDRMDRAVLATGFPVDRKTNPDDNVAEFHRVLTDVRAVRCLGAASMDLCYTAAGVLDGFWEMNLHEWDVAAGALIVEEAGGKVTRYRSDRNVGILAATPAIFNQVLPIITPK